MANVKKVTGFSRVSTHLPAQAALLLIDRAVAADRSVSAYVADILMSTLNQKPKSLPQLIGGRRPRNDVDPSATVERVLRDAKVRSKARSEQVEAQKKTARRI